MLRLAQESPELPEIASFRKALDLFRASGDKLVLVGVDDEGRNMYTWVSQHANLHRMLGERGVIEGANEVLRKLIRGLLADLEERGSLKNLMHVMWVEALVGETLMSPEKAMEALMDWVHNA